MLFLFALFSINTVYAGTANQLSDGRNAIENLAGCYLVDYSFTETESLKPGYQRDSRVYDVNSDKSIKEWIYAERIADTKVRLQHILFAIDRQGQLMAGSELRHQAEDWEYSGSFLYDFTGPLHWDVKALPTGAEQWTRKITNLDDGLRYQCASNWDLSLAHPEWACANYAPIPGRETRDMARKDYNTLERNSRIVAYGNSWLERQLNTKVIDDHGLRTPLAKEFGKTWYVRIHDQECEPARTFAKPRQAFWQVLRETWDDVFVGDRSFVEKKPAAGSPSRYEKISALEEKYRSLDLSRADTRAAAKAEILAVINEFRE